MISIVIPTIRPKSYKRFLKKWDNLFKKHKVQLVTVIDGKNPTVNNCDVMSVMGEYSDLIYNFNDGIRNLGFAYIAKYCPEIDIIISFDDDVEPYEDTIKQHIDVLNMKVPISWMATARPFTRGFPYNKREEAEVVLSHGVWEGVADWDASSQLVNGNPKVEFYKGVIPKGIMYPHCAMNFAFKRKLLPYVYQAPMFGDLNRFADIWGGIECKKDIDRNKWAVVTGYAKVNHNRASNVFVNLIKEARGIGMNEERKDEYFKLFKKKRERWIKWINKNI